MMDVVLTQMRMVTFAAVFVVPVSAISWSAYEIINRVSHISVNDIPAPYPSAVSVMAYSVCMEFAMAFMITHKVRGWIGVAKQLSTSTILRISLECMMLFLLTKNVQHWSRLGMALGISLCSFFSFSVYNFIVLNGKDPTELVQGPNPNQDVKRNAAIHVLFVALINCLTLAFPFWVVSSVVQFGISVSRLMIFNFCILPVLQIYMAIWQQRFLGAKEFDFVRVTNFALVQFPVKVIRFTHTGEFPSRTFWLLTCTQVISDRLLPRIALLIMRLMAARAKKISALVKPETLKSSSSTDNKELLKNDDEPPDFQANRTDAGLPTVYSEDSPRQLTDDGEAFTEVRSREHQNHGKDLVTARSIEAGVGSESIALTAGCLTNDIGVDVSPQISPSSLEHTENRSVSLSHPVVINDTGSKAGPKLHGSRKKLAHIYPEESLHNRGMSVEIHMDCNDDKDDTASLDFVTKNVASDMKTRTQVVLQQAADRADTYSGDYHGQRNDYTIANYITTLAAMFCATLLPDAIRVCSRTEIVITALLTMAMDLLLEIGLSLGEQLYGIPVGSVTTFSGYTFLGASGLFISYYMAVYAGATSVISIG